jgi:glycyl-tRNA synthetase beta chain
MPELLLELGTEELPATTVARSSAELAEKIESALLEAGVLATESQKTVYGTPRRLIVSFPDVATQQPDRTKEQRGPGLAAAFGADGQPSQALLGFCRSQGVDVADLRNDGLYVWVTKTEKGKPTRELLAEILPKAIRSLTFDKTMRWGTSRMRFARPIRWMLAAFDKQRVDFEIEGVASGTESRGHRFYSPAPFAATNLTELTKGLRERKVEPDPEKRKTAVLDGARKAAGPNIPDLPPALVDENTYLTEWPTAIAGDFHPDYLELPASVLVTAMAKHEKMFPTRDAAGKLTNRFVFVRNSGEDDSVSKGCAWVLNARFNDAKFFFDEDQRQSLDAFLEKTNGIIFQEKLGTVRQRADRLANLCRNLIPADKEEVELASKAGLYAKADLATGLVGELTSLQGIIGGEYARREGFPEPVCWAIETQYNLDKNPEATDLKSRLATRLVMADQLDKLAGYLGIGMIPSGSSDPFALRRAVTLLIEAALGWPDRIPPYSGLFQTALDQYTQIELDQDKATLALCELFGSRYASVMPDVRYDILQAAIIDPAGWEATDPQGVRFRVQAMEALSQDIPFVQTATRPMNIVSAAKKKGIEFGENEPLQRLEHSALESASGLELFETLSEQNEALGDAAKENKLRAVQDMLKQLEAPINCFFDDTMVMVDEPDVRYARLTLLHATSLQLLTAGDFTKLVIEG